MRTENTGSVHCSIYKNFYLGKALREKKNSLVTFIISYRLQIVSSYVLKLHEKLVTDIVRYELHGSLDARQRYATGICTTCDGRSRETPRHGLRSRGLDVPQQ